MIKGGLGNIMKQAQKMQEEMKAAQEKLEREEVTGESGGGMVKVTMNGKHEVRRVEIDDSLPVPGNDESHDVIWVPLYHVSRYNNNLSTWRMVEKTRQMRLHQH